VSFTHGVSLFTEPLSMGFQPAGKGKEARGEWGTFIAEVVFPSRPPYVTRGQLVDVVEKYLESHPEERHEAGTVLVV
jgi:hypothetical protein